ncbi:MAG: magnesium/cobalt transporter CorA [Dehalococcoides mccartyi]|jgi:magnesium Mg(2+) and cobalt Co(2+) transport protein (corA)|uniref:Magnesium transport protein CorA n=2 Tax=root TaxID=1 RepID=A0AB33HPT1_9CHLR|nr:MULTISPECIES: magnesium/cobalt transporter CorA [Dehalococcoides]AII59263.1 magnesium transporter [Dehalococcoides mccartyi CG4]AQU02971.1 magnesium and cobalt transport protein CorA [Dehalococcoides mccartyi]AQU04288.1 magnesium and cobalt transport protein CorA [Dehalococcoides mccartyi]MBF4482744.1 magnesium/cobalt transporter CorA [Dehalococcoides mccartyi]MBJ7532257.1 magnesium/cobalt transporter CorA [Dehalococcoides mccartyi]
MTRQSKKYSQKAGMLPGSVVFIGEGKTEPASLSLSSYTPDSYQPLPLKTLADCSTQVKQSGGIVWVKVSGLQDTAMVEELGKCFNLHPLTLEDVVNTEQRPKLEDYGNYLFAVIKALHWDSELKKTRSEHISLILGKNFLISFQEHQSDIFNPIHQRLQSDNGRIRKLGADYLLYSILDIIVDGYFSLIEGFGDYLDEIEEQLLSSPSSQTLKQISEAKKEMLFIRKSIWPVRETVAAIERSETPLIDKSSHIYFRDIYDHLIQQIDTGETYRDMLSNMIDIYLSSLSNRMSEVMKVLTIFASIFIPLTFIVGIYGMNFDIPELRFSWGYPGILLFMLAIALVLVLFFKRKKWL